MIEISRKKATSRKHSYIVFSSFSFDCFNCRCCWCWWGVLKAQDTHREEGKNLSLFFSNAEHFLCYVHFTMDEHIYSHARKCTFASSNIAITTLHSLSLSNSIRTSPLLLLKKIHWKLSTRLCFAMWKDDVDEIESTTEIICMYTPMGSLAGIYKILKNPRHALTIMISKQQQHHHH